MKHINENSPHLMQRRGFRVKSMVRAGDDLGHDYTRDVRLKGAVIYEN